MTALPAIAFVAFLITCGAQPVRLAEFQSREQCDWFAFTANNQGRTGSAHVECWPAGKDE